LNPVASDPRCTLCWVLTSIFWDYLAFAAMFVLIVAGLAVAVFVLGTPGLIAIARKHPEAEAVNLMGGQAS
jgi:hypothetical protein